MCFGILLEMFPNCHTVTKYAYICNRIEIYGFYIYLIHNSPSTYCNIKILYLLLWAVLINIYEMNRKLLSFLFLAFAVCFGAGAQVLWKVQKPDSDKASYLLGTHHAAPDSMTIKIPGFIPALKEIKKVYVEVLAEDMYSPANMAKMQQMVIAPADSTLDKLLEAAQLDSLRTVWDKACGGQIPFDKVVPLKPSFLSTQILALECLRLFPNYNPSKTIDMVMQAVPAMMGKEIDALETADFQMNLLYGAPMEKQAADLMKYVRKADEMNQQLARQTQAYLNQDLNAIEEEALKPEDAEDNEKLIFKRNDKWMETIVPEMSGNSIMVVVGAAHLVGERGLIDQLRKAGYTVTPAE